MPEYDLSCSKSTCKHVFTEICTFDDFKNKFKDIKCPECGKKKPKKVFAPRVYFAHSTDKMNNFDYAARTNMEKAELESFNARTLAKKKGVVSPYGVQEDYTQNGKVMNTNFDLI